MTTIYAKIYSALIRSKTLKRVKCQTPILSHIMETGGFNIAIESSTLHEDVNVFGTALCDEIGLTYRGYKTYGTITYIQTYPVNDD